MDIPEETVSSDESECGLRIDVSDSEEKNDDNENKRTNLKRKRYVGELDNELEETDKAEDGEEEEDYVGVEIEDDIDEYEDDDDEEDEDMNGDAKALLDVVGEEIHKQLEAKASKCNLTKANVKNILQTLISHKDVLAMVRQSVNVDQDFYSAHQKITRAKARQLRTVNGISLKTKGKRKQSDFHVLIEHELPEDSSDEEYCPTSDQSDEEDHDSTLSSSDVECQPHAQVSTKLPKSPPYVPSNNCATQTTWSDDGLFKIPQENIGQRTRSKLSLNNTPLEAIEKAFVPPDITTDMYDSECDDDDWKKFLNDFTEPLGEVVNEVADDDDADPEFNLLEEMEKICMEKLKSGKSNEQFNLLIAELFELAASEDKTLNFVTSIPEVEPPKARKSCKPSQVEVAVTTNTYQVDVTDKTLTGEQLMLLQQQMRQHIQLLTQHFIQTFNHPVLHDQALLCKSYLISIDYLAKYDPHSTFNAANLEPAMDLIKNWELVITTTPKGENMKRFIEMEINTAKIHKQKKMAYTGRFPQYMLEVISKSTAFIYPLLLPPIPYRCDDYKRTVYLPSEDHLIALGLEQFLDLELIERGKVKKIKYMTDAVELISEYMIPTNNAHSIYLHIQKCSKLHGNPIKYYFENKRAPATINYVVPFVENEMKPPIEQPPELLPDVWRKFIYPNCKDVSAPNLLLPAAIEMSVAFTLPFCPHSLEEN